MGKIQDYFNSPRISNSLLGSLDNPFWLKWKRDHPDLDTREKVHFKIGSAVDTLLTDNDNFENYFQIIDAKKPSGYLGKFIEHLPPGLTEGSPQEEFLHAYEQAGYTAKLSTVLNKYFWGNADAVEYYNSLQTGNDKEVLGKNEYDLVLNCVELIKANPFTLGYFLALDEGIELFHQIPIYFEYSPTGKEEDEEECKSLLDGIRIDHNKKTIQPFDLKTSGFSILGFGGSYLKFGYYRQAAFYMIALEHWLKIMNEVYNLEDYELLPFQFIVVSNKRDSKMPAMIYQCSWQDIIAGKSGGYVDGRYYKGVDQLLLDYRWHENTGHWSLPRDVYENDGIIYLNIFDNENSKNSEISEFYPSYTGVSLRFNGR